MPRFYLSLRNFRKIRDFSNLQSRQLQFTTGNPPASLFPADVDKLQEGTMFHRLRVLLPVFALGFFLHAPVSRGQELAPLPLVSRPLEAPILLSPADDTSEDPIRAQFSSSSSIAISVPVPQRPIDAIVVGSIAKASYGLTRLIQLNLVDGEILKGRARTPSSDSFVFQPRGSSARRTIRFDEVASTTPIKANAGEVIIPGLQLAGLAVFVVATLPLGFLWGASCGFQCS